jgi:hypothetical protein
MKQYYVTTVIKADPQQNDVYAAVASAAQDTVSTVGQDVIESKHLIVTKAPDGRREDEFVFSEEAQANSFVDKLTSVQNSYPGLLTVTGPNYRI